MTRTLALSALAVALAFAPSTARGDFRDWLRSKNSNVERGNEKVAAGDAKSALPYYDKAARELPAEGGVHLNRGLALMQTGDAAHAREALHLATQPPASTSVRADAHYDLGIDFYREADALAAKDQHEEAQQLFREAADAFRQSLRLRPGSRDAAWNLELAARRIREQEEKQKEKEKQDEQNKKDQDKNDPQKDQQQQDEQKKNEQKKDQKEDQKPDQQKQDEPKKEDQQKKDQQKKQEQEQQQQAKPIPAEVGKALDALQDSEENLERLKARMRAQQERRTPEKDW